MNMNDELARLVSQIRASFEGPAWHGPAVLKVLRGVDAAQARPIPGAHTIWELVLHLGGAYGLVLRQLHGDVTQLAPDEDWPVVSEPAGERCKRERAASPPVTAKAYSMSPCKCVAMWRARIESFSQLSGPFHK